MRRRDSLLPIAAVVIGVGTFNLMDAAIKSASLQAGVYNALLFRNLLGTAMILPVWLLAGPRRPGAAAMKVHVQRAVVIAAMALLFFYGLVRIPMAEAIALSFIAPIIALYFAAVLLGETIRPRAIGAALLGLAGVVLIGAARFGAGLFEGDRFEGSGIDAESGRGVAAVLASAVLYALNLVLQRRQAQLAGPVEVTLFQNLLVGLILATAAPWLAAWPAPGAWRDIVLGAALASIALLFLTWGYARAEAQVLLPIEYTAFLWAALFGWLWFGEEVGPAAAGGAALIVAGCWIAARGRPRAGLAKRPENRPAP